MQSYSKEQLALLFGVKIQSIESWIDGNRFVGITRENQDQINDLTLVAVVTGELLSIAEVKELYEKNQTRFRGGIGHDN